MEGNGMAGGMMPGMLGLEMPLHQLHHHHHHQTPPPPSLQQQQHLLFASQPPQGQAHHNDADHNAAVASKHVYPFGRGAKAKPAPSSEDEPSSAFGDECSGGGGVMDLGMKQQQQQRGVVSSSVSATPSPWQRMKWTDTMVKILIMVVYCVGDDGGPEGGGAQHNNKTAKKGGSATGAAPCAGLLQQQQQKKGKWKSVSRAMMERGYNVSPQQCEDKFNDLNKRYKRVNDILGKGTACQVVENQELLNAMDHLSPKAKEEVRKLLNSKHLFFREMCAYHRSCAAAAAANAGAAGGGDAAALQSYEALAAAPDPSQLQQQRCYHPSDVGSAVAFPPRGEVGTALKMMTSYDKVRAGGRVGEGEGAEEDGMVGDEDDDEDDDDYDEDDYGDDEDEPNEDEENAGKAGGSGLYNRHHHHRRHHHEEEEEDSKEFLQAGGAKRQRRSSSSSPYFPPSLSPSSSSQQQQQLRVELAALSGTPEQQRQWLKWRAVELEEQRVSYGRRALQLEKQRFKWLRFSGNKEREMERAKLENERLSLENDRMLLFLRQKEFDLLSPHGNAGGGADHLHHSTTSPNGALPTTSAA